MVSGERSSWLTSEVKRASRSIRSWSWSTIVLNDWVRPARSGSSVVERSRVSRSPPAMATAARDTAESGRSERPLASRPINPPSTVVMRPPSTSASASTCRVWSRSARLKIAKYIECPPGTAGSGIPTATWGVVSSTKFWVPGVPLRTSVTSPLGRLAVDRLSCDEYGVPW